MTFAARPYQVEAAARVVEAWARPRDGKEPLVAHATGLGKTELGLHVVVSEVLDRGGRVVWLAHRDELVSEPYDRLTRHWPKHGFMAGMVKAERDACDAPCVFASVQTLARPKRLRQLLAHGVPDVVVVDEAHHSVSPSYMAVLAGLCGPETRMLGLTATPDRDDGADLGRLWRIVHHMSLVDGAAGGWLVDPYAVVRLLPGLDRGKVQPHRHFDDAEAASELLKRHIVEETVKALAEPSYLATRLPRRSEGPHVLEDEVRELRVADRTVLVFTHTIEQAQLTAVAARDAGWSAAWMSGDTPDHERKRLLRSVRTGRIRVICNAGVLMEGTDVPRVDAIVLARAFQSRTFYVQGVGRGLRLYDEHYDKTWQLNAHDPRYQGKRDCLIIDLVGATQDNPLVVAPLLTGEAPCVGSPSGHAFEESPDGRGYCQNAGCDARWACFKSSGPHAWGPDKVCKACGAEQCPDNPESAGHRWIRQPDFKRKCEFCETIVPDPWASLVGREATNDSAPIALHDVHPETWAVDLGSHGIVLLYGSRQPDRWMPVWVPNECPPKQLMTAPVEGWHAWAVAKDLIKRMQRTFDAVRGREVWGGHDTEAAQEAFRTRARDLAIRLGVAGERAA